MFLTVCEKLHFPAPAVQTLTEALDRLAQDPTLEQAAQLFLTEGADPTALLEQLADLGLVAVGIKGIQQIHCTHRAGNFACMDIGIYAISRLFAVEAGAAIGNGNGPDVTALGGLAQRGQRSQLGMNGRITLENPFDLVPEIEMIVCVDGFHRIFSPFGFICFS